MAPALPVVRSDLGSVCGPGYLLQGFLTGQHPFLCFLVKPKEQAGHDDMENAQQDNHPWGCIAHFRRSA